MFNYTEYERYMKTVRKEFPTRLTSVIEMKQVKDWSVIAKCAGMNSSAIYAYRDGVAMPTARSLILLSSVLGVSVDWLLSLPMKTPMYMPEDCEQDVWCILRDWHIMNYCANKFYNRLHTVRCENGCITQSNFAKEMNMTHAAIRAARQQHRIYKADNLGWLCYHFGVSADWMLGLTEAERVRIGLSKDSAMGAGGREPQELTAFGGLASAT